MNGSVFEEKKNALGRFHSLDILAKAMNNSAFKLSVVSTLAFIGALSGDSAFAQQNVNVVKTPVSVASPWTTQDGRTVIDLNAQVQRQPQTHKSNYIRQTAAVVQDDSADLLGVEDPLSDYEMENPEDVAPNVDMSADVMDPTPLNAESAVLEEVSPAAAAPLTPAPVAEPAPAPVQNVQPVQPVQPTAPSTTSNVPAAPVKPAPVLSTEVQNYPQSNSLNANSNNQGTFSNAASNAPRYSTNPYSRIGQAEYNPNQFYGGGGNYSVNGYRNTPPAEAYGQSVCGGECGCGSCCGVFGGILQNTQLEAGAVSMRSPMDFDDSGNTGADFAINFASAQPIFCGLNVQAGARGVFTDYNGVEANGFKTDDSRNQLFWTAGMFFRSPYGAGGWSGGVVYDSLTENYYREYELSQVRAELSYDFSGFCDIGFRGAFALDEDWCDFLKLDDDLSVEGKVTGTSYYTMFLRKRGMEGGEFTVFGGATEWSEGLIGATAEAPLSDSFVLRGATTYVFPTERGLHDKTKEESWNISVGIAWYLGGNARNGGCSQRPLFDVADNGSFLQNFLR